MEKTSVRKPHVKKSQEQSTPEFDSAVVRLGGKVIDQMAKSLKALIGNERRDLIEMLRLNLDKLEKKYAPPS